MQVYSDINSPYHLPWTKFLNRFMYIRCWPAKPSDPSILISNLFQKGDTLVHILPFFCPLIHYMWFYLCEQEKFKDFNNEGALVWHETNIPYAVWKPESTRTLSMKYYPSENVKHNSTVYARVFFARYCHLQGHPVWITNMSRTRCSTSCCCLMQGGNASEFDTEFKRLVRNGNKSIDEIRATEFTRLDRNGVVYLDHAGATLYFELQMESVFEDLNSNVYGNPHIQSEASAGTLDIAREAHQQVMHITCLLFLTCAIFLVQDGESYQRKFSLARVPGWF
ncbi:Transmembrane CLPTM1 family protein [Euphorbia peplus]|nr:Transmembrane CLPTM1 family protein [Euphorbia peplus]